MHKWIRGMPWLVAGLGIFTCLQRAVGAEWHVIGAIWVLIVAVVVAVACLTKFLDVVTD